MVAKSEVNAVEAEDAESVGALKVPVVVTVQAKLDALKIALLTFMVTVAGLEP